MVTKVQKQRYLCKNCDKIFVVSKLININSLWYDYVFKKQILNELSTKY